MICSYRVEGNLVGMQVVLVCMSMANDGNERSFMSPELLTTPFPLSEVISPLRHSALHGLLSAYACPKSPSVDKGPYT